MIKGYDRKIPLCLLFLTALSSCGVSQKEPPKDDPLGRTMDVARQAVYYSKLQQAEIDYRKSYQYALTRDDAQDIDNAGYNLAVVQLDMDKLQPALKTVQDTGNELAIRHQPESHQLDLVEAAILYRLHRYGEATQFLQKNINSPEEDIQERTYFFSGLVANDQQNMQALSEYSQKLDQLLSKGKKKDKDEESWKADQGELKALLAYRSGRFDEAISTARQVEQCRRQQVEYRAMIRALVIQAEASQAKNDRLAAAQLYVRAGKSATMLKEYEDAKRYLNQVLSLHADDVTYNLAVQSLQDISTKQNRDKDSS